MTNFTPQYRKAPSTTQAAVAAKPASIDITASDVEVRTECSQKLMSQVNGKRAFTGDYFLNAVTPKLFAMCPTTNVLHAIPAMYANFDNTANSIPVKLATALSESLVTKQEIPQLQYFFKLIDSKTKATIATDLPERAKAEASEVADFLKPQLDVTTESDGYVADPKVCAWLYIYAEQNGAAVRIGYQAIEARFAKQVNVVRQLVANSVHIQASVVPQTKVLPWLTFQSAATTDAATTLAALEAEAVDFGSVLV